MINFAIKKSLIPIIWIDTSVITNMTIARYSPGKLEKTTRSRVIELHEKIKTLSRQGKIICPLASQELEVWINRDSWLDTINDLGIGISCINRFSIQESQLNSALISYAKRNNEVKLSYTDIFFNDPVEELKQILQKPYFITTKSDIIFGAKKTKEKKINLLESLNNQREINVRKNISYEKQLERESLGDIEALLISANKVLTGTYDENSGINDALGYSRLMRQVNQLSRYSEENKEIRDLVEFYKSDYCKNLPYINVSARMFSRIMTDKQEIKHGDEPAGPAGVGPTQPIDCYINTPKIRAILCA